MLTDSEQSMVRKYRELNANELDSNVNPMSLFAAPKKYITVEWRPNQETEVDESELMANGGGRSAPRSRRVSRVTPAADPPARPVSPSPTYTVSSPSAAAPSLRPQRRLSVTSPLPAVSQPPPEAPRRPLRRREATLVNQMVFSSRPPSGLAADGRSTVVYLPQVEVDRLLRTLTEVQPGTQPSALPGVRPQPSPPGRSAEHGRPETLPDVPPPPDTAAAAPAAAAETPGPPLDIPLTEVTAGRSSSPNQPRCYGE